MNSRRKKTFFGVLVYRLSNEELCLLQTNPKKYKSIPDLSYGRCNKECSVLLKKLKPSEEYDAVIRKGKTTPLSVLRKYEAKTSIFFGYEIYLNIFKSYLIDSVKNQSVIKKELSKKNIKTELLIWNADSGGSYFNNGLERINKNLVAWLIKKYQKARFSSMKIQFEEQLEIVEKAAEDAEKFVYLMSGAVTTMVKDTASSEEKKKTIINISKDENVESTEKEGLIIEEIGSYEDNEVSISQESDERQLTDEESLSLLEEGKISADAETEITVLLEDKDIRNLTKIRKYKKRRRMKMHMKKPGIKRKKKNKTLNDISDEDENVESMEKEGLIFEEIGSFEDNEVSTSQESDERQLTDEESLTSLEEEKISADAETEITVLLEDKNIRNLTKIRKHKKKRRMKMHVKKPGIKGKKMKKTIQLRKMKKKHLKRKLKKIKFKRKKN